MSPPVYRIEMKKAPNNKGRRVWWWCVRRDEEKLAVRPVGWSHEKDNAYNTARARMLEAKEQDRAESI